MTVKYDTEISKLAIICTQLAYEQFDKGLTDSDLDDLDFEHGGMLYDYLFHKEDMAGNHRFASNYTLAVNSEVPVNKPALTDYPISCR